MHCCCLLRCPDTCLLKPLLFLTWHAAASAAARRSPTVVIAYLMKLRGWRLAESYKWVKDKRPQIKISEGAAVVLV